LVSYEYLLSH